MAKQTGFEGFLPDRAIVMKAAKKKAPKTSPIPKPPEQISDATFSALKTEIAACTQCKLCASRTQVVVGEGNEKARLVFVGEGPGAQEDLEGRPFIGRSGQLLTKMIEAMGIRRQDVYICNVVKCRPPENRNPEKDEVASCRSFLWRQLDAIKPQVIVALGKFAAQTLLETETPISELRGSFFEYRGAQLIPTFHPAYLLRNPPAKKEAWEDLKKVMGVLGLPASS